MLKKRKADNKLASNLQNQKKIQQNSVKVEEKIPFNKIEKIKIQQRDSMRPKLVL